MIIKINEPDGEDLDYPFTTEDDRLDWIEKQVRLGRYEELTPIRNPEVDHWIKTWWGYGPGWKMDWLQFELVLRMILRDYKNDGYAMSPHVLMQIDEVIAAFTRRGHELK